MSSSALHPRSFPTLSHSPSLSCCSASSAENACSLIQSSATVCQALGMTRPCAHGGCSLLWRDGQTVLSAAHSMSSSAAAVPDDQRGRMHGPSHRPWIQGGFRLGENTNGCFLFFVSATRHCPLCRTWEQTRGGTRSTQASGLSLRRPAGHKRERHGETPASDSRCCHGLDLSPLSYGACSPTAVTLTARGGVTRFLKMGSQDLKSGALMSTYTH